MNMQAFPLMQNWDMPTYDVPNYDWHMSPQSSLLVPAYDNIPPCHLSQDTIETMCDNCGFDYFVTKLCNSCASNVCNRCMADGETCCLPCLSTFPVYPSQNVHRTMGQSATTCNVTGEGTEDVAQKRVLWSDLSTGAAEIQSPQDTLLLPVAWEKEQRAMTPKTLGEEPGTPSTTAGDSTPTQLSEPLSEEEEETEPTLMLCNIPCRFGHDKIVEVINSVGFTDLYDFIYVPQHHSKRNGNIGYAFIHFHSMENADWFMETFQNYQFQGTSSSKKCVVKRAHMPGFNGISAKLHGKPQTYRGRRMIQ